LPSDHVRFPTGEEVLAIHERRIEVIGGPRGARDAGLLESALDRPRTGYYDDLSAMAAALFESLLMNHPFLDGNQRTAFFATDVLLRLNGWKLEVDADAAPAYIIEPLEQRECDDAHLLPWIREASERR
jgi:death-on-curing protein